MSNVYCQAYRESTVSKNCFGPLFDDMNYHEVGFLSIAPDRSERDQNRTFSPDIYDYPYFLTGSSRRMPQDNHKTCFVKLKGNIIIEENNSTLDSFISLYRQEASSAEIKIDDETKNDINKKLQRILHEADNELFDSDVKSNLSKKIEFFIDQYSENFLNILCDTITSSDIENELLCETLRTIGQYGTPQTRSIRLKILIAGLNHGSPVVRDSAALGFADMEDPGAIQYIEEALKREKYLSLKNDYEQIINDLRSFQV